MEVGLILLLSPIVLIVKGIKSLNKKIKVSDRLRNAKKNHKHRQTSPHTCDECNNKIFIKRWARHPMIEVKDTYRCITCFDKHFKYSDATSFACTICKQISILGYRPELVCDDCTCVSCKGPIQNLYHRITGVTNRGTVVRYTRDKHLCDACNEQMKRYIDYKANYIGKFGICNCANHPNEPFPGTVTKYGMVLIGEVNIHYDNGKRQICLHCFALVENEYKEYIGHYENMREIQCIDLLSNERGLLKYRDVVIHHLS